VVKFGLDRLISEPELRRPLAGRRVALLAHPASVTASLDHALDALAAIGDGGYPEALARAGELLARRGMPVPLARLELKAELVKEYADLLPDLPLHEWKRIRGEQDAIVHFEPERALETFPQLLDDPADRERFLQVLERLTTDPRVCAEKATPEQIAIVARIRQVLGAATPRIAAAR